MWGHCSRDIAEIHVILTEDSYCLSTMHAVQLPNHFRTVGHLTVCAGKFNRHHEKNMFFLPPPPQAPSVLASSGSSEEDLLANWQRMFVEKMAPTCDSSAVHRTAFSSQTAQQLQRRRPVPGGGASSSSDCHRAAYSDGEEGSSAPSWTPSRGSSLDTDTDVESRPGRLEHYSGGEEEGERLLLNLDEDDDSGDTAVTVATSPISTHELEEEEDRDTLPNNLPVITSRLLNIEPTLTSQRPQRSPKRMGVHHLHRKDSLTRAQEHGTLLGWPGPRSPTLCSATVCFRGNTSPRHWLTGHTHPGYSHTVLKEWLMIDIDQLISVN